jgi:hypothetical protein
MKIKTVSVLFLTILLSAFTSNSSSAAFLSWKEIEKKFKAENLNTKALSHVQCFFEKHENTVFQKKMSIENDRCAGSSEITLDSKRVFALIDYTASSNTQRMYLVDRQTGGISLMAVAHGKYNAGMFNMRLSQNKNSIRHTKFYSNEPNSNAPSSGFFVAGNEYEGKFGRSLVLNGLETGINDNACERAVVIHKHFAVTASSAYIMSAGCPMISKSNLDHVVNLLEGRENPDSGLQKNGSVVFIYGERESKWKEGTCDGNFSI